MQSRSTPQRLFFAVVHWVLVLLILALIGLGWYLQYLPQTAPEHSFLINLHISLGLTSAILIVIQIFLWLIFGSFPLPGVTPHSQGSVTRNLYILIYACAAILGISGFLQAIAGTLPLEFWGLPIPVWEAENPDLALLYEALHQISAIALTVLTVILVGVAFIKIFQKEKYPPAHVPKESPQQPDPVQPETAPSPPPKLVRGLSRKIRLFAGTAFWIQLVFGIVTALLLYVVSTGQTMAVNVEGPSSGDLWAKYGFTLLCLTTILFFYYTRLAQKIAAKPDFYINSKKQSPPWLLTLNYKLNFIGTLLALIGIVISISLLMAKTVSMPPGIAITDPTNIVRALDVLVLLINFELLIAHFIGVLISVCISLLASNTYKRVLSTVSTTPTDKEPESASETKEPDSTPTDKNKEPGPIPAAEETNSTSTDREPSHQL